MPAEQEMPDTIRRSSKKAQRTWAKAHDSAVETYGEGRRAHQTAYAALKHSFQKKGDRWVAKDEKGPSDERAAKSPAQGETGGETYGGVDVRGSSKQELYERARDLGIRGRSKMSKQELGKAIAKKQG
ncbi:MAG: ChaB family protein [Actinomycetota bacterium]|nr:ChaB family protein [Actinomycetota bacterium]